jgi:hypothetical protein
MSLMGRERQFAFAGGGRHAATISQMGMQTVRLRQGFPTVLPSRAKPGLQFACNLDSICTASASHIGGPVPFCGVEVRSSLRLAQIALTLVPLKRICSTLKQGKG